MSDRISSNMLEKNLLIFFLFLSCTVPYNLFGQLYYQLTFDLSWFMFFAIFFLASHELHYLEDFFLPQLAALTVLCTHAAFFVWSFQDWFLRGFFGYVIYNYSETIMVCINTGCTNFFFFFCFSF